MTSLPNAHAPTPAVATGADALCWVAIRSLAPRHRPRILAHLLALDDGDRYLRFGHVATDSQIGRYVDQLDFDRDEIFGVFNRRLETVAMAHLAYLGDGLRPATTAEFGVSVAARLRGRGIGARLFGRAMLHARNRRIDTLIVNALSENTAMLRLARSAGAQVARDGADSTAVIKLPPENLGSRLEAALGGRAAELDYGLKRHARHVDALWGRIVDGIPDSGESIGARHTQSRGDRDLPAV